MKNYRNLSGNKSPMLYLYTITIIISIGMVLLFNCTNVTEPINKEIKKQFIGQISHDINTAIIKKDSTLWMWGPNISGQLGIGSFEKSDIPVRVKKIDKVLFIDLLEGIAIAADEEGDIWFWGNRMIWIEPPALDTAVLIPRKISHLRSVKTLEINASDVYLLCEDGSVWSITLDHNTPSKYLIPNRFSGMDDIKHISGTLALKHDGTLHEFIHQEPDYGGLLQEVRDIVDVDNVWNQRTVILKKDGTVWAWGQNKYGQLGDSTFSNSIIPVRVKGLTDIVDISAKYGFNLALKKDGSVWYWGVLGLDENNKLYGNPVPQKIEGLDNINFILADNFYYFIKRDGTFWYYEPVKKSMHEIIF